MLPTLHHISAKVISISPHTWFRGAAVCGVDPAFADLPQRLTTSPASSASIERVFSIQFHTQQDQESSGFLKSKQACLFLWHAAWIQGLGLVNCKY